MVKHTLFKSRIAWQCNGAVLPSTWSPRIIEVSSLNLYSYLTASISSQSHFHIENTAAGTQNTYAYCLTQNPKSLRVWASVLTIRIRIEDDHNNHLKNKKDQRFLLKLGNFPWNTWRTRFCSLKTRDGILEQPFKSRFLCINLSLLKLEFYLVFYPHFFLC